MKLVLVPFGADAPLTRETFYNYGFVMEGSNGLACLPAGMGRFVPPPSLTS